MANSSCRPSNPLVLRVPVDPDSPVPKTLASQVRRSPACSIVGRVEQGATLCGGVSTAFDGVGLPRLPPWLLQRIHVMLLYTVLRWLGLEAYLLFRVVSVKR